MSGTLSPDAHDSIYSLCLKAVYLMHTVSTGGVRRAAGRLARGRPGAAGPCGQGAAAAGGRRLLREAAGGEGPGTQLCLARGELWSEVRAWQLCLAM